MKKTEKINLNLDIAALFVAYISLECAIDSITKERFTIKNISKNSYKFLDALLDMIKNTRLSLSARSKLDFVLAEFPSNKSFVKTDIAKKLFLDIPIITNKDKYQEHTKHVQPDNNVLKNIENNFDTRFIYTTSQLRCDGNKEVKPRINTSGTIIIYIENTQFLKYTCVKNKGSFSVMDNKMRNVMSSRQVKDKIKNTKDFKKIILFQLARIIKDIGIITTSKIYDYTFLTYDNFAALISYKIFKVNTMLSQYDFNKILYYKVSI